MLEKAIHFPKGFLWGAATAAHQVEGGNRNNDWWEWEQHPGATVDGSRSGAAAEWWTGRAEEDLRRAAAMGHNAHRLSVEWSRLEPSPGIFDEAAFARYGQILGTLRNLGMSSSVTLYHFTLPRWAARMGGWTWHELPDRLARFAGECVTRLGDLVDWWATINEPMILVYGSYLGTRWPPGAGSLAAGYRAAANLLRAHHAAYLVIKSRQPNAPVGIVTNMHAIEPSAPGTLDRIAAGMQAWIMKGMTLGALERGTLGPPLSWRAERLPAGAGAVDWYGMNYYGRHLVRFDPSKADMLFGRHVHAGIASEEGDWGEVYPKGLTSGLRQLARYGKPVFVTENGIFDNDDTLRPAYLLRHIRATHDAIQAGADVRGYFYWSLVDNFEWAEGWSTRFGLIEIDPVTQQRRPRHSAQVYEKVIRANGVMPELWQREVG
ncbi:MAG: glycoside hydrolase family 1 protein [Ardenticatenaceae bacterium]